MVSCSRDAMMKSVSDLNKLPWSPWTLVTKALVPIITGAPAIPAIVITTYTCTCMYMYVYVDVHVRSGVVGNFLLWER